MKDQFYVVLPSNSSMNYFKENTTTHYVTQLSQQLRLEGAWNVALTEIQVPLTFQHIQDDGMDRNVQLIRLPRSSLVTNETRGVASLCASTVRPGIYKNLENLLTELNNLDCLKSHLYFNLERGGYGTIKRTCLQGECKIRDHELRLSKKLMKILGFPNLKPITFVNDQDFVISQQPANLANALPTMLMVYTDICEPYATGDVHSRLLRAVSLSSTEYIYGAMKIKTFSPPMYLPVLYNSFQTIEIDIRDQQGLPIPFDYGTLTVTLHLKRLD